MDTRLLAFVVAGLIGGAVRSIVGWQKERYRKNTSRWTWAKARFCLLTSAVIGGFAGALLYDTTLSMVMLAGYAGGDFIEGMYKSRFGEKTPF